MNRPLLVAGLRARLLLLLAVLAMTTTAAVGRLRAPELHWQGSTDQGVAWLLIGFLVLPTLVALLATHTFRGEHSTWSWALARPLSRRRVFRTLFALDAATIVACVLVARVLLGPVPGMYSMLPGVRLDGPSALVCVLGFLYLSTAAMAASGRSFLRAAGLGLAWALVLAAAPAYAFWGFLKVTDSYVPVQWTMMAIADACGGESGVWVAGTLAWLGYLAVPAIGTLVPTARATRTLPLAPSMRQIATPGLVAFLAWTAVLSVVQLTLYVTAPDEVRYGDRVLVVETDFPEQSSPMPYLRLFPVGIDRDRSYTDRKRSNRYDSGHLATTWSGLHSGSYEVCLAFEVRQPTPQGTQEPGQHYEVCEPVEVTDAESPQVVDLDLDPSRAVPARH